MSWFDEAEELLAKWKESQKDYQEEVARYLNKFTPRARRALSFAIKEARETKASCIGVEHLLVGLLALGNGVPFQLLQNHGLTLEVIRAEILKLNGGATSENLPHYLSTTPRLNKVLKGAEREAVALGHTYIGTDVLLLALLAESEGVSHRLFTAVKIDPVAVRNEVLRELGRYTVPPPASSP